jgi:hypothetical protein
MLPSNVETPASKRAETTVTLPGHALALGWTPALADDVQWHLQQLGIQTLRLSVLNTQSLDFHWACSISDQGQLQPAEGPQALDSMFPGGSATVLDLMRRPLAHTSVQKQSPRRWLLAWRLRDEEAVVVDALFHDRRDVFSDADSALLRLLCNSSLARATAFGGPPIDPAVALAADARGSANANTTSLVWPQIERRASSTSPLLLGTSLLMLALGLLSCLWLVLSALPQTQHHMAAQEAEFETLRDGTMRRALSLALATGDYGEVQVALQGFAELGYFQSAVVANDKQRLVATAGEIKNQRIGDAVSAGYGAAARNLALATGSQQQGQLMYVANTAQGVATSRPGPWMRVAAGLGAGGCLLGLWLLLQQLRSRLRQRV